MSKFYVMILVLLCASCSSKKYDYRGKAQTFTPTNTNAAQNRVDPMSSMGMAGGFSDIPMGSSQIPPMPQMPVLAQPAVPVQQQVQKPSDNQQNMPLANDSKFYYPYQIEDDKIMTKNEYLQDYYGRRADEKDNQYSYIETSRPKPTNNYQPAAATQQNYSNSITMSASDKQKFGILSNDSFGPNAVKARKKSSNRARFNDYEESVNRNSNLPVY